MAPTPSQADKADFAAAMARHNEQTAFEMADRGSRFRARREERLASMSNAEYDADRDLMGDHLDDEPV